MVIYARNSATAVLAIWEVVRIRFYDQDIGSLVEAIKHNLRNEDLLSAIQLQPSERFLNLLKEQEYEILISKFFDYYWSRLPVLLSNRVIRHGEKRRLTDKEIEIVSNACFKTWAEAYPNSAKTYVFSGDYTRFDKLRKWYVKSARCDDAVYSVKWLWDSVRELYTEITAYDNVANITTHVIESCFPMFWDTFQGYYGWSLFICANRGWFVGDLDTEEACEELERERRGRWQ